MRLIIGISGASGVIYGIRLLEALRQATGVETHLVISNGGKINIALETHWKVRDVEALADVAHSDSDVATTIASGSFRAAGMIVAPCSMKTLSAIVNSYAANLLARAADVTLKEGRRLVLAPRETLLQPRPVPDALYLCRSGSSRTQPANLCAGRRRSKDRRPTDV